MKKKGLDRGLEAPLDSPVGIVEAVRQGGVLTVLKLEQMQFGKYQPCTRMDEGALQEFATSIQVQGLTQPILVRKVESDGAKPKYEIIVGECRSHVSRLTGSIEVPVPVRDVPDESIAAMALIENIQHEDLNQLEEAQSIVCLVHEFQFTHEQVAESVGRPRSAVSDPLRLLNLVWPVQTMLMAGDLNMGHARALFTADGAIQTTLVNQIVNRCLSVREVEKLVVSTLKPLELKSLRQKGGHQGGRDMARLEEELADQLGLDVQTKLAAKEHDQLTVQFSSLDEFDGLLACLCLDASEETA